MGETTHQIEAHIEDTRAHLGSNLHELEDKVKAATDWKQYFQTNPMTLLAVAFGGGVLLAGVLSRRENGFAEALSSRGTPSGLQPSTGSQTHKAMEMLDQIKGALIGVAATRFKDFVGEIVPGFHEEFQRTERNRVPPLPH
jgi:hypothetical protein